MTQKASRVILITGSNSGIGKATAEKAVKQGHIVYGGARQRENFPAIQEVGAHPVHIDVTDEQTMVAAVESIERRHGAVDVLVNNAGYGQMGPIEAITREQWLHQYNTNVFGLVRMAQLVIPGMRHQQSGRILNISSAGGEFTFPLAGAYHSTKYAVESINEAMRYELKPFGIHVITIQPGPVSTPLAHSAANSLHAEPDSPYWGMVQAFQRTAQNTMGYLTPERVADAILCAMTSRNPRPRYKIGMMANTMPLIRSFLPDRLWDRFVGLFYT